MENLLKIYQLDPSNGADWYTEANAIAREMADMSGLELIQTAGIVLDEQAAGLHPRDALYQIAEELGLDSPHVVHAHK